MTEKVQKDLCAAVQPPDLMKPFVLRTDAVLLQENKGKLYPVGYASKKLSLAEAKYLILEKECLALLTEYVLSMFYINMQGLFLLLLSVSYFYNSFILCVTCIILEGPAMISAMTLKRLSSKNKVLNKKNK